MADLADEYITENQARNIVGTLLGLTKADRYNIDCAGGRCHRGGTWVCDGFHDKDEGCDYVFVAFPPELVEAELAQTPA